MGLRRIVRVGKQIQTKLTNISLAVILSVSGLAGSAPLFLTQKAHAASPTDIVINEIFPATGSSNKWVEIYNKAAEPLDISNWRLYRNGSNWSTVFTSGTTINGHGFLYFESTSSSLPLNSGGSPIELWTGPVSTGMQIDSVDWGSLISGQTYGRTTDGSASFQVFSNPSQGWENNEYYVSSVGSDSAAGGPTSPFATITKGVSAVTSGGTVHLLGGGPHVLSSTLLINKPMTLAGAGQAGTTVTASSVSGYGIQVESSSVTLRDFTLVGPSANAGTSYGVKIAPTTSSPTNSISSILIENVTVQGSGRSEIDLNGVDDSMISSVTVDGLSTAGVGIAMTDSNNITLSDITTSNNNWGGVGVFTKGAFFEGGSDGVAVTGTNSFNEPNPLYTEEEGGFLVTNLNASDFTHIVHNSTHRLDGAEFTYYQQSESNALAFATALTNPTDSVVRSLANGNFIVGNGLSIQTAVNIASGGAIIQISSGSYGETVTVNKTLSLLGAQSGVDARTRSTATETVMNASGGAFNVTANDVVIDGFTIQGAVGSPLGTGISLGSSTSGVQVRNNIIQDNIFGLYLNGHDQTVEQNVFRNNNQPGSASGDAIYSDQGLHNSTVENNYFTGHASAAMVFSSPSGTSGLTINNNNLVNDNSIVLLNATASSITNNVSLNSNGSTIFIGGGVNGLAITGNTLQDGLFRGIRVAPDFFGFPDPNQNITVHSNKIVGNIGAGIDVTSGRYVGTLDATSNWWGSNLGPSSSQVVGNVDTSTWCADDTCTPPFLSAVGGTTTLPVDEPVDLSGLVMVSGGNASAEIPGTNEVVISATSGVEATIQGGTTVTASDTTWDGTITPPVVSTVPAGSVIPGTVGTVIEIGSSTVGLTFDQPVRLLIPGQAGKRVGFIPAGSSVFTEITTPCVVDSGAILAAPGINECKIDVGSNLVIWTNHFTKFVTYAPAVTSSGGGSSTTSGSSSSTSGRAFTPPFIAAAASGGVLGSSLAGPQTSSTATEKRPAVAQATPVRSNAGELLGLMWYWWLVILMLAGTALYGIYRMADTTERR